VRGQGAEREAPVNDELRPAEAAAQSSLAARIHGLTLTVLDYSMALASPPAMPA